MMLLGTGRACISTGLQSTSLSPTDCSLPTSVPSPFQRHGRINSNQKTLEKLVIENVGAQLVLKGGERAWWYR